jgi:hypothetical protein
MELLNIRAHAAAYFMQTVEAVLCLKQEFFKLEVSCPPQKLPRCLKQSTAYMNICYYQQYQHDGLAKLRDGKILVPEDNEC